MSSFASYRPLQQLFFCCLYSNRICSQGQMSGNRLNWVNETNPAPAEGCSKSSWAEPRARLCTNGKDFVLFTWRCHMTVATATSYAHTHTHTYEPQLATCNVPSPPLHAANALTSICMFIVELHNKTNLLTQIWAAVDSCRSCNWHSKRQSCNVTQFWQNKTKLEKLLLRFATQPLVA